MSRLLDIELPERDERLRDFRNFLYLCWKTLGLPDPTPIQYDVCEYAQHGPDRLIIEGFRGVGKSWVLAAFVVHQLYWDPTLNILVVSASKTHADDISTFILQLIHTVPGCNFLSPAGRERHSKIAFDVGPAPASKQPSVKSVGITGQMTGSRADIILADDVESLNNSLTQGGRERIAELIKEFDSIVKPGGRIVFLGTPQTEQSIYNVLPSRGYDLRVWPSEYPDERLVKIYGASLAPIIKMGLEKGARPGDPTDPLRFGALDLSKRRASYGRSGYALQFLLDTSLSDAERYPLKLSDLIISGIDPEVGPERLLWSPSAGNILADLPNVGFNGDRYYGGVLPQPVQWYPYQGSIMAIDPSGTGADETGYSVVKHLHGHLYVPAASGLTGGYSDPTLIKLAMVAKEHKVNKIVVEANFGDGMYTKLLTPHVARIYPCAIEEVKHSTQKERRIIDTLEPVMNQHRLILDRRVIENDAYRSRDLSPEQAVRYQLMYQLTRITRDRGSLAHDDRLDALAIGVRQWLDAMAQDVDRAAAKNKSRVLDEDIREFMRHALDLPKRGEATWISTNRGAR